MLKKFYFRVFKVIGITLVILFFLTYSNYSVNIVEQKLLHTQIQRIAKVFGPNVSTYVTVVSIYVEINLSKHSIEEYNNWTSTFLTSVTAPLIMVVDEISFERIKKLRGNQSTTFYVIKNIWEILHWLEIERNMPYIENYKSKQSLLDPEEELHNPSLYAIWNLKAYLMDLSSKLNPYQSDFFIYTDAGAWRDFDNLHEWPDTHFTMQLHNEIQDRILFSEVQPDFQEYGYGIEGGFFAGSKNAIQNFAFNFYKLHDERLKAGMFIGKDQTMMDIIAYNSSSNKSVARLQALNVDCDYRYDEWFFYQLYFSKQYSCKSDRLSLLSF